jgi:hypothetical protein
MRVDIQLGLWKAMTETTGVADGLAVLSDNLIHLAASISCLLDLLPAVTRNIMLVATYVAVRVQEKAPSPERPKAPLRSMSTVQRMVDAQVLSRDSSSLYAAATHCAGCLLCNLRHKQLIAVD